MHIHVHTYIHWIREENRSASYNYMGSNFRDESWCADRGTRNPTGLCIVCRWKALLRGRICISTRVSPHLPSLESNVSLSKCLADRLSGLWGAQTPLGLWLQENEMTTLFFAAVNVDQCVVCLLLRYTSGLLTLIYSGQLSSTLTSRSAFIWQASYSHTDGNRASMSSSWISLRRRVRTSKFLSGCIQSGILICY